MKQTKHNLYLYLLSLILLINLMTAGCHSSQLTLQQTQSYEQYTEEHLSVQKKFDEFTEGIFKDELSHSMLDLHFFLVDPNAYGITDVPVTFGDYSLEFMKSDTKELKELHSQLAEFDPNLLTEDQKLTYEILNSVMETNLLTEGLELYDQPLTSTIGIQAQLPVLLAEYSFYNKQDVEDYLTLIQEIDTYYAQFIEFEKLKSQSGLFMCDTSLDNVLESCEAYLIQPEHSFMSETFNTRIDALEELTDEEKEDYKSRNIQALTEHFVPAYESLIAELNTLRGSGKNEKGLCYFPDGKQYYEYLVQSSTGTSYETVDELLKAIELQMSREMNSMSKIIAKNSSILDKVDDYSFKTNEPTEILEDLKNQIQKDFPELPDCNYSVKYVPEALQNSLSPAFYLTPPLDRFQDNSIYINGGEQYSSSNLYTTLAHEGYPGHLYQSVYFINSNNCNLRHILSFNGYSEGWATYVEYYSYTLDNGLDSDLGNLLHYNDSLSLGLYAYLDINIHYNGWDKEQTAEYLSQYFSLDDSDAKSDIVDSIYYYLIDHPTNYLEYYVGYLEITNMKNTASRTLENDFILKDFHTFLLDIGPAPFSVIHNHFKTWLDEKQQ